MCVLQVADFTSRTASGALTAALSAEVERLRTQYADAVREKSASDSKCRKLSSRTASGALTAALSAEVERLRTQHADAVREKTAADSKCRKLADKVAALEKEKADLRRQLAGERREANEAIAKEQAAQAEAKTQHADAVREKTAADSKCRKLADKVAALEKEKADLRRQLAGERREANEAIAKEQAAQAEAKLARAEGNLAKERAEQLEERLRALQSRVERAEAATRVLPGNAPSSWRSGSAPYRAVWRGPKPRRAQRLSGPANSLWIHTMSWARGPLSSKCRTESPDFAAWSGCRRSCRRSPPSFRGLCLMLPWSPARGR